jgi:hypothetical protein
VNYLSATVSLPITLCRTLGKLFAQRKVAVTVPNGGDGVFAEWQTNRHSAKGASVSPITVSVSSVWAGTRQRRSLCRVPGQHALGKGSSRGQAQALCRVCGWHTTKVYSLPSAMTITLSKETLFVFLIPSKQTKDIYHWHLIYITCTIVTISYITNNTYLTNIINLTCFFTNITKVHKTHK